MPPRMHHDELHVDVDIVRRLLAAQHPQWADLPLARADSTGTSNAMFRLGDDLVVRLPLRPASGARVGREHRVGPLLAPHLPITVPTPIALGEATDEYPMPWSVYPWLPGDDATHAPLDLARAAEDLGRFLTALWAVDPAGGPSSTGGMAERGGPLTERDDLTRRTIASSARLVDVDAVTAVWDRALAAPTWDRPGVWIHGDIASGNLLVVDRRISAVIDLSAAAVGDPACDLIVAWELFDDVTRPRFRDVVGVDDATWERGRGWAVSTAILALAYYEHTNRFMFEQASHKIDVLLTTA